MNCNILLMGLTGVGKSSLINYLADKELAEAGITSGAGGLTRGIHKYSLDLNGQPCIVADTEGLEANHSDFWKEMIADELLKSKAQNVISDWYHIVVYCIGANGGRVQDIELQMIEQVVKAGYGVIIAFTKADLSTDEDLESMEKAVKEYFQDTINFSFIPVCSKKTRMSEREGKEQLAEAIIDCWGNSIKNLLPTMIYNPIFEDMDTWFNTMEDWIENQKIGFLNRSKEDVLQEMNKKIDKKVKSYIKTITDMQTLSFKDIQEVYKMLNTVICSDSIQTIKSKMNKKIEALEASFVFDSSGTIGNAIFTAGAIWAALTIPIIGVPALIFGALVAIGNKGSKNKELINAFRGQFGKVCRMLGEQKNFLEYSLGEILADGNSYRELAKCYLKGYGVKKDLEKCAEYLNKLICDYNLFPDKEDSEAEYYIAYFSNLQNDEEKFKYWIALSSKHGDPRANRVINGEKIEEVEKEYDEAVEANWNEVLSNLVLNEIISKLEDTITILESDKKEDVFSTLEKIEQILTSIKEFKDYFEESELESIQSLFSQYKKIFVETRKIETNDVFHKMILESFNEIMIFGEQTINSQRNDKTIELDNNEKGTSEEKQEVSLPSIANIVETVRSIKSDLSKNKVLDSDLLATLEKDLYSIEKVKENLSEKELNDLGFIHNILFALFERCENKEDIQIDIELISESLNKILGK